LPQCAAAQTRYEVTVDLEHLLQSYAELVVKVGVNVQPGQRLLIIGSLANGGTSLDAAPLVRHIAARAYQAGASLVETIWGDEALQLARFKHAPRGSFDEFSSWLPNALAAHVESGHAILSVYANNPDLLKEEPPELVGRVQQATSRSVRAFREHITRNQTNWAVVASAAPGWAAKVFPDLPADQQIPHLWEVINRLCRLSSADPVSEWQAHIEGLAARSHYLNRKRYAALKYTGPGTDLTIGLPARHVWVSGQSVSRTGIRFTANLPTEEVFTLPHKDRVNGTVRSSKPLSFGGTLIEDFSLQFVDGRVVGLTAQRGEAMLRQLVETDPGAGRLGEVALVPDSSPVAQSGLLFYNTLFDENAASHVALGSGYKFTVDGGDAMDDEEFERAGGNRSAVHVDFMIGSKDVEICGIRNDGTTEPLMKGGEWIET
jgi:aminopeptidase